MVVTSLDFGYDWYFMLSFFTYLKRPARRKYVLFKVQSQENLRILTKIFFCHNLANIYLYI